MKYLNIATLIIALLALYAAYSVNQNLAALQEQTATLGATISTTATTDTLETFRTNVNASLTSLRDDSVSTSTAYTWTALQKFFAGASTTLLSSNFLEVGGTATTTITSAGKLGIASTSPFGTLGIGASSATSTISGGRFCAYFLNEVGTGVWIKIALNSAQVFSTSTSACQ